MKLFITILIISILAGTEVDLFIPSFPELQTVFDLSPFLVQLTLSVNFIAYCICSLFAGALGDRHSRRVVILSSLWVFILGSLLCVSAHDYIILVLGRLLQGMGMAAPSVLGFVVIADKYPLKKQPAIMGVLNGVITLAMACAPVIGSYVNVYFNWRGNFFILLGLGILSLVTSYLWIPQYKGDHTISLSPKAYLPLIRSKQLWLLMVGMCALPIAYWVFIGMAPILYMGSLGVGLKHFGYYQGALALMFSLVSISSPLILSKLGAKNCLRLSYILSFITVFLMLWVIWQAEKNPMLITGVMLVLSIAAVFPIQILYPSALELMPRGKAKVSALITAMRLLVTAFLLEIVSYFYTFNFLPIGLCIAVLAVLSFIITRYIVSLNIRGVLICHN
jgi:DHA1 family bicyclomycin/chloramphenicol resistance-like MFS transporter